MYSNATLISNFLGRALTAYETTLLTTLLPAVDTWIDSYLNSTFGPVSETTRYYDGHTSVIDIDPCTAISSIVKNDQYGVLQYTYLTYEYILEPINETVKREIRKRYGKFTDGIEEIAVSAKFSEYDNGIPEDIQIAATRLAAGIINAGKIAGMGGNVQLEKLEGHEIRYDITNMALKTVASSDPILLGILGSRKEVLV